MAISIPVISQRVSLRERAVFAKELSTMLTAGLHLAMALEIIIKQTRNPYFRRVIMAIHKELVEGKAFSMVIARFPDVFDRVFVNIVRAGEQSGQLELVLKQLAKQLAQQYTFTSRLKTALIYPSFVIAAMIAVAILATVKIIPPLRIIFEESKLEIPATTRFVIGLSDFVIHSWYVLIVGLIILLLVVRFTASTERGALLVDRALLKDPFGLSQRLYLARFARNLGMMLGAGIPIVDAVKVVAEVVGNRIYKSILLQVARELERGMPMSVYLQRSRFFPAFISQMIVVGEQTGQLDQVLLSLADFYEEESESSISNLTALFEPVVIVIIGVGIGFLVYSIIIPIYNLAQAI